MSISRLSWYGALCAAAVCSWAHAQDNAAKNCLPIDDPMARLACYDRAMSRQPQASARVQALPQPSATERVAGEAGEAAFGLPAVAEARAATSSMVSRIDGPFDGWQAGTRWTLANGQVWAVADGSSAGYPGRNSPQIRVLQGAFGGYFAEIEGVSHSPRVRRIR